MAAVLGGTATAPLPRASGRAPAPFRQSTVHLRSHVQQGSGGNVPTWRQRHAGASRRRHAAAAAAKKQSSGKAGALPEWELDAEDEDGLGPASRATLSMLDWKSLCSQVRLLSLQSPFPSRRACPTLPFCSLRRPCRTWTLPPLPCRHAPIGVPCRWRCLRRPRWGSGRARSWCRRPRRRSPSARWRRRGPSTAWKQSTLVTWTLAACKPRRWAQTAREGAAC